MKAEVFIKDTGVNIERTVTESKNYQIKPALTKCEG